MDGTRFDQVTRSVATRRGFFVKLWALGAAVVAVYTLYRSGSAQASCQVLGATCTAGVPCCDGGGCNFDAIGYGVGRCGALNADGTIATPPALPAPTTPTPGPGHVPDDGIALGRRAKHKRRKDERQAYRRRRKRGKLRSHRRR